ncbi:MAG TPA: SDR family NAD(P)-dependent oxidoreductase [Chloroflexota bacterium]|jgi:NAD(P)-dependent dehydrogenase (short-subunit alcohol dehydrogenase family)
MTMSNDGRVVLITGAADGIGRGIATRFAQAGCRLVLLDVNEAKLERTAADLPTDEVLKVTCDVRKADQVQQAVDQTIDRFGRLDVAVSNAGVYPNTAVVDMEPEEWDLVIETNLTGSFLVSRAAARQMLRQGGGGKLCLIASGAYQSARLGASHYCASKAGLVMFARTLALELAEDRINVNVVSPGLIAVGSRPAVSERYKQELLKTIPWGRAGTPEEIGHAVYFVCSPEAEYLTGSVVSVDGGSSAGRYHLPRSD